MIGYDLNAITLESYERHPGRYIDGTAHELLPCYAQWLRRVAALTPDGGHILEIGSAFGRDASYLEGVPPYPQVIRTDAARSFVDYLRGEGHQAHVLNLLNGPVAEQYPVVFASAVFHHLTGDALTAAMANAASAVAPGGHLCFGQKRGDRSFWEEDKLGSPRHYTERGPGELWEVTERAGLAVVSVEQMWLSEGPFLTVTAVKQPEEDCQP